MAKALLEGGEVEFGGGGEVEFFDGGKEALQDIGDEGEAGEVWAATYE